MGIRCWINGSDGLPGGVAAFGAFTPVHPEAADQAFFEREGSERVPAAFAVAVLPAGLSEEAGAGAAVVPVAETLDCDHKAGTADAGGERGPGHGAGLANAG